MKKRGFTLVELLVVIAIIALLMGILMPALARVRRMAHRMLCGTNLSGLGRAMIVYANEHDDDFPRAGKQPVWASNGEIDDWKAEDITDDPYGGSAPTQVTVTASWYLLVKYADVTPESFVCKGDTGTTEFDLSEAQTTPQNFQTVDAWDFGGDENDAGYPGDHCSYSMHHPYGTSGGSYQSFALDTTSNSAAPVAADRNPLLDKNARDVYVDQSGNAIREEDDTPDWDNQDGFIDEDDVWNSAAHQREGQNVLYVDSHVTFEKDPTVGIDQDNIWKRWTTSPLQGGNWPDDQEKQVGGEFPTSIGQGAETPGHFEDSYMINEVQGGTF